MTDEELSSRILVLHGIPAAGKTTLAHHLEARIPNAIRLSNDEERAHQKIPPRSGSTGQVYQSVISKVVSEVSRGKSVIVDATFYKRQYRAAFLRAIRILRPQTLLIEVVSPLSVCRDRVLSRLNHVSGLGGVDDIQKFDSLVSAYTPWRIWRAPRWLLGCSVKSPAPFKWQINSEIDSRDFSSWLDVIGELEDHRDS